MSHIPTTFEMDGLLTDKDIENKDTVVFQCALCRKWTVHPSWVPGGYNRHIPCIDCKETKYDARSIKSLRTYNPLTDNKRKIK